LSIAGALLVTRLFDIGSARIMWGRLSIAGVEPNVAARVFFVGAVIMCFRWRRLAAWALSSVTIFCWLLTFSRSGLLAFGALALPASRRRFVLAAAVAGTVSCALLLLPGGPSNVIATYAGRVADTVHLADYNTTSRVEMVQRWGEQMSQNPLVGTGMGILPEGVLTIHNAFLGIGAELGLLGMLSLLSMYAIVWGLALKLERGFGMLNVLVVGTIAFDLFMSVSQNRIFWFPLSLVLALYLKQLASPMMVVPGASGDLPRETARGLSTAAAPRAQ
jgi:O-antigen ligase